MKNMNMMINLRYNNFSSPKQGRLGRVLCLRVLALLCLMMASVGAWAQQYVFISNETPGYFLSKNGNNVTATTTFAEGSCVWTERSNTETLAAGTSYQFSNGGRYLYGTNSNTGTLTTATNTNYYNFRIDANRNLFYYYNRANKSVYRNNTYASWANSTIAQTRSFRYYTYTAINAEVTASISGEDRISATGTKNYSATANYTPLYYQFTGADTRYYAAGYTGATTTKPTTQTTGITYTWSLEGADGYASVNNSGVVTYSTLIPERERTVTLKCTATHTSGTSTVATKEITLVNPNVLYNPSISFDNAAGGRVSVTLSYPENDPEVKLYYTTNGDAPSSSSTEYAGPFEVASPTTIKVIAVKGSTTSSVVSMVVENITPGVSDGKVVLDDREDHTWTYYAGVDTEVDGGHYNTTYIASGTGTRRDVRLYSPKPRNVKITYKANGGAVSIDESATEFVYYKTLEQGATENEYPYQVISNPFSKRPTGKGFGGWQITKGANYIKNKAANATLGLDEEIVFENLGNPGVNVTAAEIEFTATWVDATITHIRTNTATTIPTGGNYETKLVVVHAAQTRTLTINGPCTIMMVEPDGSADYRNNTMTSAIAPVAGAANTVKIEFSNWEPGNAIDANGRNLTIGRGMKMDGTRRAVYGINNNTGMNQTLKIESGNFSTFRNYQAAPGTITKHWVILGNDYDRANGDNDKLSFSGMFRLADGIDLGASSTTEVAHVISKSGRFMTGVAINTAAADNSYYIGVASTHNSCYRYLEIQGGEWVNIAGGMGNAHPAADPAFTFRMRGGLVTGSIYGAGAFAPAGGIRTYIITGGEIGGWIAAGCNGIGDNTTTTNNGATNGNSFVYIGGNVRVGYQGRTVNEVQGGNIFGAGRGASGKNYDVGTINNSNVVVADNCQIEHNVYGGGNYGLSKGEANIYITGGTVDGNVFGGSNMKEGYTPTIYMTGGLVKTGVYGGCNTEGTINNSVTMQINGGQVGVDATHTGNIHGGGYGSATRVNKNVDITLGKTGAARDADGVTVYGDVYGGSALGSVNGTSANNTYHTNVTMNAGFIHGSLYGGALGSSTVAANVYGPVQVKVYRGSVMNTDGTGANGTGAVYGANNINGAPQRSVTVDIYGTNSAPAEDEYALFSVYGGGNQANYTYGNGYPKVTVHNCDNSIEYVYGGGNAAAVSATDVTIYGGNKIGNVFGGGNGQVRAANVTGGTNVKIYGGTIGDVYGGSNTNGTIGGTISVNVNAQAEPDHAACPVNIDNVYGGGNKAASNVGNITIGCAEHIGAVYGGANQANITGNINLSIVSGHIDNVFGGNNTSGNISGTITVTVNDNGSTCGMEVGNVYGGGNKAAYGTGTNYPVVNINNGHLTGSVFGGGLGETAVVTGNPQVTIGQPSTGTVHIDGNVFGGGDAANVVGRPVVLVQNCNTMIGTKDGEGNWNAVGGTVYGGGNAAHVTGAGNGTSVTINGGDINRVFGGGNGEVSPANVQGNAVTVIHAGNIHQAFAGSNMQGNISGSATITVDHSNDGCEERIDEVYGGGNQAAGNAGTVNIDCGAIVGDVYGGANQANINSDITLNITGGTINRVFGGNNTSGNISGAITVNVNKKDACALDLNYVYGAGNQAAYTPSTPGAYPAVNILKGTVKQDVFGGGLGATAIVTSNPTVTVNGGTVSGSVYGGGDAASVVGNTTVALTAGTVTNAFGGGNAAAINGATTVAITNATAANVYGGGNLAGVSQTATINMTGGNVTTGLYGGCNTSGTVTGAIAVNVTGGRVGTDAEHKANVHGGGYGSATQTAGNVAVAVNGAGVVVYGDIYGGSALGNVNDNTDDNTTVTITAGTVNGDVYGGGLGDASNAALVNGNVAVNINGGTVTGNVFGCNNVNGTPKGSVAVTVAADASATIAEVYGGGNMADYSPTTAQAPKVTVNGCGNTIGYVYGGGNAADVPATNVTIWGGTIDYVFGGGHGDKDAVPPTAANVGGDVSVNIKGGTIGNIFAGSNSNGNIDGDINLSIVKDGDCEMHITDVYGGGNEAAGNAGTITIGCTGGNTEGIGDVYGGANAADINSDITLNITGGKINNVFGGNNASGSINGGIEVNVDWDGNCTQNSLGNVYGGGNLAQYAIPNDKALAVNIKNGTVTNNVYGGGKGDANDHTKGQVTGNPVVTIGVADDGKQAIVNGDVYGGGDAGNVVGTPVVNVINKCNTQIANVYGGGNAADVSGTDVNIDGGTITGMVFGGGHGDKDAEPQKAADVNGNVNVDITGGTINKVFGGSNSKGNITGTIALNIDKGDNSCDMHIAEVYGGGNEAAGNAGTITIGCTGGNTEGIGDVYGGANAADINSDITLNITGGKINNVFGGNNASGSINGGIEVNVDWDGNCTQNSLGNVYGGGNLAQYAIPNDKALAVNIKNGTVTNNVYGGGKGDANDHTKGQVTGNPVVTIGVADDGKQAIVNGDVYGGGDAGNVVGTPVVNVINKCNTQIANVYGGGNAADVSGTDVNIDGGNITGMVFGGGHGDKNAEPQKAADVNGKVNVDITGGTINKVFGGSNSKGNIKGQIALNINKADNSCDMHINEVYGGGNEAAGNAGTITIGCTGGETEGIQNVYGGANAANISNDITLNITGGNINNVFGGNNTSGTIDGTITVTVDWNGSCTTNHINNVYGAGNQAPYTGSPVVNIYNCTISEDVFGGGLGSLARVTGDPRVNVETNATNRKVIINGSVYGGGSAAPVKGNPVVEIRGFDGDAHKVYIGNYVFGGGLGSSAVLTGSTSVNIYGNTEIGKNVYGGGNGGEVTGDTNVTIGDCN